LRIIFFGSSEFSVPSLGYCLASGHEVVAVVTTPDQPKGRGLQLQSNPVKARSEAAGVPIYAPAVLRDPSLEEKIAAHRPDAFVVVSYGKLIPSSWLKIPREICLNIHPSLLPKHRGAAPITWQILEGDKETGVTIADVTKDLDAGDIFCQIRIPLGKKETTKSLTLRLSNLATEALREVLELVKQKKITRTPQKGESSYARKLSKEDGLLNLNEAAELLERKIRAFDPWPGAFIGFQKQPLRLVEADFDVAGEPQKPGLLLEVDALGYLKIQTGKGSLKIFKVQLPGRQVIAGKEFANGQRLKPGFLFENLR